MELEHPLHLVEKRKFLLLVLRDGFEWLQIDEWRDCDFFDVAGLAEELVEVAQDVHLIEVQTGLLLHMRDLCRRQPLSI